MNAPKLPPLPERLRDAARKLRTSSIPLADFIPLLQQAADAIAAQGVPDGWQPIETAPRDGTSVLAWCVHSADSYFLDDGSTLTLYGAHTEGFSHVADGVHVVVWGGAFDDSTFETPGGYLPDWWFKADSDFEVVANPTHWMPLPAAPGASTPPAPQAKPIDMVLHCPSCGMQHVDAPSVDHTPRWQDEEGGWHCAETHVWTNPPHRSHMCQFCGHVWRPADVPTNGVQAVKTKGKADSPLAAPQATRCELCQYQHGHQIGCANNPVDIALKEQAQQRPFPGWEVQQDKSIDDNSPSDLDFSPEGPGVDGFAKQDAVVQQEPVAYLDIGAVGYIDLGTDLSTEQLQALPAGRHMLGIIGTFGADGYVPAQQAKSQPLSDEHVTDGSKCWCDPELVYKDPDTGAEVLVHRGKQ